MKKISLHIKTQRRRGQRKGFTLVEILAAVAVFGIMSVFMVQIAERTLTSTRLSNRAVDAAGQARLVFDRMSEDITRMVLRSDVDYIATLPSSPSSEETVLQFLSHLRSPGGDRDVSIIAYRVAGDESLFSRKNGKLVFQRAAIGLNWDERGFMGLNELNGTPVGFADFYSLADGDFITLAEGVFRVALGYQLATDYIPPASTTVQNEAGEVIYDPPVRRIGTADILDWSVVSHLVVGVISTDIESRKLLTDTQIVSMANTFSDPLDNQLPKEAWYDQSVRVGDFPGIPLPAVRAMQVFQRFIPIQHRNIP